MDEITALDGYTFIVASQNSHVSVDDITIHLLQLGLYTLDPRHSPSSRCIFLADGPLVSSTSVVDVLRQLCLLPPGLGS